MASITNEELKRALREILKGADLSSLSSKKVRKKLEERFDADFTARKREVDELTMMLVKQMSEEGQDDQEDEEEEDVSQESEKEEEKSNGADENLEEKNSDDDLSSDDDRPDPLPPKKKQKTEKKKKNSDKSVDDEEMARRLQEEENGSRRPSRSVTKKSPKPRKERSDKGERKGKTAYARPCLLSAELSDIMGTNQMARSEVVKKMWKIIKERKLQDPKNKQFMICDDQLIKVFGKERVKTFGMMKFLKNHIKDIDSISISSR